MRPKKVKVVGTELRQQPIANRRLSRIRHEDEGIDEKTVMVLAAKVVSPCGYTSRSLRFKYRGLGEERPCGKCAVSYICKKLRLNLCVSRECEAA